MDALLTERQEAQRIVEEEGDDVMSEKRTSGSCEADIELVCTLPTEGDRQERERTVDSGHGRIETAHLTTSEALVGDSDWPGLAQVFAVGRHVITQKTGKEREWMPGRPTGSLPCRRIPCRSRLRRRPRLRRPCR